MTEPALKDGLEQDAVKTSEGTGVVLGGTAGNDNAILRDNSVMAEVAKVGANIDAATSDRPQELTVESKEEALGRLIDLTCQIEAKEARRAAILTQRLDALPREDLTLERLYKVDLGKGARSGYTDQFLRNLSIPDSFVRSKYFVSHDLGHLSLTHLLQSANSAAFHYFKSQKNGKDIIDIQKTPLPEELRDFYISRLPSMKQLVALMVCPHQALRALAERELGREPQKEPLNLSQLADTMATMAQMTYIKNDFVISSPDSRDLERNEIVLDVNMGESPYYGNLGEILALLQNPLTNACKAISEKRKTSYLRDRLEGTFPENPEKIYLRIKRVENNLVIEIEDSGDGIDEKTLRQSTLDNLKDGTITPQALNNHYQAVVEGLPLTDEAITYLASIQGISGFAKKGSEEVKRSTGQGLAIVKLFTDSLGGTVQYGKSKELGGLSVKISIPDRSNVPKAKSPGEVQAAISEAGENVLDQN